MTNLTRALSLSQPWPHAFLNLGKNLDNRTTKHGFCPAICRHRGPLYLHAASSYDENADAWMRVRGLVHYQSDHVTASSGSIFARAVAVAHLSPEGGYYEDPHGDKFVHRGEREPSPPPDLDLRWHMRGTHWALVFSEVVPTKCVPCRGMLGLWRVPTSILATLEV